LRVGPWALARFVAAAGAAMLAVGCAGNRAYVQSPAYGAASLEGRTLLVFPVRDVRINNPDDYEKVFRTKDGNLPPAEQEFNRAFAKWLEKLADHARVMADSLPGSDSAKLVTVVEGLPLNDSLVPTEFQRPENANGPGPGSTPDLGLQVSRAVFLRSSSGTAVVTGGILGIPITGNYLELTGRYLLWDYKSNAPVAFGRFNTQVTFQYILDRTDWDAAIGKAVESIVKQTPLQGKKLKSYEEEQENTRNGNGM
jgi:hypothetical protein